MLKIYFSLQVVSIVILTQFVEIITDLCVTKQLTYLSLNGEF